MKGHGGQFLPLYKYRRLRPVLRRGLPQPDPEFQKTDYSSVIKEGKKKELKSNIPTKRYAKSGLNEELSVQIYSRLNEFMYDDKLYKNDNLTLTELAKCLVVHPNHLSQVINEKEGKNFYNYINSLRIKEFIRLVSLPESKKYTMISLAYDCGFSTKSTFNKHFKVNTGKTPTDFFSTQSN